MEFGLIFIVITGDISREKGPNPANEILGRFEEWNSFCKLSICYTALNTVLNIKLLQDKQLA